jgi:hypothetical protein
MPKINRYPITIEKETTSIANAGELAVALDVLQGQYDRDVLTQLQPHLVEIIANASGLLTILRSLSIDDQLFLIRSIGQDLASVIQSASALRDLLAVLADTEVESALIATLGSKGLRRLISTGTELAEVLEWVYGDQDSQVISLLGDSYMRRLCRHASDLSAILHNLDFEVQDKLLEKLGWSFIVDLVRDGYDLATLLRSLPPESSDKLLHHFSASQLVELIGNPDEWDYLFKRLEPAEADTIMGMLNLKSPQEAH